MGDTKIIQFPYCTTRDEAIALSRQQINRIRAMNAAAMQIRGESPITTALGRVVEIDDSDGAMRFTVQPNEKGKAFLHGFASVETLNRRMYHTPPLWQRERAMQERATFWGCVALACVIIVGGAYMVGKYRTERAINIIERNGY